MERRRAGAKNAEAEAAAEVQLIPSAARSLATRRGSRRARLLCDCHSVFWKHHHRQCTAPPERPNGVPHPSPDPCSPAASIRRPRARCPLAIQSPACHPIFSSQTLPQKAIVNAQQHSTSPARPRACPQHSFCSTPPSSVSFLFARVARPFSVFFRSPSPPRPPQSHSFPCLSLLRELCPPAWKLDRTLPARRVGHQAHHPHCTSNRPFSSLHSLAICAQQL